jgi:hypothetical protein
MVTTTTGIATEFITFSRTSNATVTDSDGKIKWAPHNLLLASEQFDAASWTKTSITPTANAVAAPNGTTTADTLTASGANGTTLQSYTSLGVSYTFGIWLKRKTGTGNIQIAVDSGTYTTVTITSDWALYTVTQTPAAGTISAGIRIVTSADAVEAWGAHLYRSDLGGMKANTSAYPMYNPTTPKNLLGFTESLTTGWTNTNTTDAIASEVSPVGLTGAVDVAATAGNGTLLGSVSLLASPYTFSVWLKRKTGAGAVEITVDGTTYVTAAVTGTWTRFSTTLTPSAGTKTPGIRLVTSGDAVYAWGAQLSDSASLDTYVPNYGAAPTAAAYYGPRLDFDPVTLAAKGLLVEEQRTNILLHTTAFDNAAWTKEELNTSGTPAWVNVATAPDGTQTASKLLTTTTNANHRIYQSSSLPIGVVSTLSVYAKAAEYRYVGLLNAFPDGVAVFDLQDGVESSRGANVTATTITPVGNDWYRCTMTSATTAYQVKQIAVFNNGTQSGGVFAGVATSGLYIWGAQLEAGSFATSYIPVGSSTDGATRNADVASVSTQAFPYNQAEGSVVVNATLGNTSSQGPVAVTLNDGSANNIIYTLQTVGTGTRRAGILTVGGADQAVLGESLTNTVGLTTKAALAFKINDVAGSNDGRTVLTDTSALIPTVNTMRIGDNANGSQTFNGHIRQITYLPRRISNTELQTRTS